MTDRIGKLTSILEQVGWRSASDVPASVVAAELDPIIGNASARDADPGRIRQLVAECLRQNAHPLDGSSTPVSAWYPTAAEIIRKAAVTS